MNYKLYSGAGIMSLLVILALGVSAFPFFGAQPSADQKTFMDSVQKAVANNDFATWKSLMESQLTGDNFNKMVANSQKMSQVKTLRDQIKQANQSGDAAKATDLKAQLSALMPAKFSAKLMGDHGVMGAHGGPKLPGHMGRMERFHRTHDPGSDEKKE